MPQKQTTQHGDWESRAAESHSDLSIEARRGAKLASLGEVALMKTGRLLQKARFDREIPTRAHYPTDAPCPD